MNIKNYNLGKTMILLGVTMAAVALNIFPAGAGIFSPGVGSSGGGSAGSQSTSFLGGYQTNITIYSFSNIMVFMPPSSPYSRFNGTYNNINPIGSTNGFIAWQQSGGTNFLVQQNKGITTFAGTFLNYSLSGFTNILSDDMLQLNDQDNADLFPKQPAFYHEWEDRPDDDITVRIPITIIYGYQQFSFFQQAVSRLNVTNTPDWFVSAITGSDLNDGKTLATAFQSVDFVGYYATHYGDVIHIGPGFYPHAIVVTNGVTLIGPTGGTNSVFINGLEMHGASTAENVWTTDVAPQDIDGRANETIINIVVDGGEAFFNGGTGDGVFTAKNCVIHGTITVSNPLFCYWKDCVFGPSTVTGNRVCLFNSTLGATNEFDGCRFTAGIENVGISANYFIGVTAAASGGPVILDAGNTFDTTASPGMAIITNTPSITLRPSIGSFIFGNFTGNGSGLTNVTPIAPTIIKTNLSLATVGVNNWGRPIQIVGFSVNLSEAGVAGVSGIQLEVPGQITNRVSSITSIAGTIIGSDTNSISGAFVPVGGTWNIRDISQGVGNSSSIGNGGQQIIVY